MVRKKKPSVPPPDFTRELDMVKIGGVDFTIYSGLTHTLFQVASLTKSEVLKAYAKIAGTKKYPGGVVAAREVVGRWLQERWYVTMVEQGELLPAGISKERTVDRAERLQAAICRATGKE